MCCADSGSCAKLLLGDVHSLSPTFISVDLRFQIVQAGDCWTHSVSTCLKSFLFPFLHFWIEIRILFTENAFTYVCVFVKHKADMLEILMHSVFSKVSCCFPRRKRKSLMLLSYDQREIFAVVRRIKSFSIANLKETARHHCVLIVTSSKKLIQALLIIIFICSSGINAKTLWTIHLGFRSEKYLVTYYFIIILFSQEGDDVTD